MNWDDYYMNMAYLVAMKSKDNSTHIGAVVVGEDNEVRSVGYNSFPRNIIDDKPERQQRPEKYFWFEHAERNSVYNATLLGTSLKGCRMYTNGIPCMDCARSIVQSGIKEVIVDKLWDDNNDDIWIENANRTKILFQEANIKLRFWEGLLIQITRFKRGGIF
jgi:dCMP deaminase